MCLVGFWEFWFLEIPNISQEFVGCCRFDSNDSPNLGNPSSCRLYCWHPRFFFGVQLAILSWRFHDLSLCPFFNSFLVLRNLPRTLRPLPQLRSSEHLMKSSCLMALLSWICWSQVPFLSQDQMLKHSLLLRPTFFFHEKNDSVRLCLLSTLDSGRMPKLKPKWQVSASLMSPMFDTVFFFRTDKHSRSSTILLSNNSVVISCFPGSWNVLDHLGSRTFGSWGDLALDVDDADKFVSLPGVKTAMQQVRTVRTVRRHGHLSTGLMSWWEFHEPWTHRDLAKFSSVG
jgi:hypothetical protein